MPLSYGIFFDEHRGHYRARRWGTVGGQKIDGAVKIPDKWWKERGFAPPSEPNERMNVLAMRYAAGEVARLEAEMQARLPASGHAKSIREVFELMKELNPGLVSAPTVTKWTVDFTNISALIDVDALTPDDVDISVLTRYRNARLKDDRRPRAQTILNEMSFLRQITRFALDFSTDTGATVMRVNRLPVVDTDTSRKVALTVEEFRTVYRAAAPRDRDILWTGASTLLRKQTLLGLSADWIDWENQWLHIDRTLLKGGRRKNRHDLEVPMAHATVDMLAAYKRREGLFWPNQRTGRAMNWYEHVLGQLAERTGVRAFSLHDLRDTGASWLYAAKVPDLVVKRLMGHAESGDVTHSYIKIFEPELRDAVAVFDEIRARLVS